jgi:diguanylate cyclase
MCRLSYVQAKRPVILWKKQWSRDFNSQMLAEIVVLLLQISIFRSQSLGKAKMIPWQSVLSLPSAILRAVVAFFGRHKDTTLASNPAEASDRQDTQNGPTPKESQDLPEGKDVKIGMAATLLTRIREGLACHSEEMATFERELAPSQDSALPPASCARMQEANLSLDELVENTVDRLKLACGGLFAAEQSHLEAYQKRTQAFGRRLDDLPSEVVLTKVLAELLGMLQELRSDNEAMRHEVADAQKELRRLATRAQAAEKDARLDALTQMLNRRAFDEIHAACHEASQTRPYSLVLVDADHFKLINDCYGHMAGDAVLSMIGRIIRENCRAGDVCARWGGEEFAILMPDVHSQMALSIAERLRKKTEATILHYGPNPIRFTVSCGVVLSQPGKTRGQILEEADMALYAAKEQGRNRSVVFQDGCQVGRSAAAEIAV